MLYRLSPPADLTWTDFPGHDLFQTLIDHGADLERLEWRPTEHLTFSNDILNIAIRHGVPSAAGIVLDAQHTVDLGRADELRIGQQNIDELQADIRAKNGAFFESIMPGWTASGEELDERVRESTERVAQEAEADLAEVLATPVNVELAEHWRRLGGHLPA